MIHSCRVPSTAALAFAVLATLITSGLARNKKLNSVAMSVSDLEASYSMKHKLKMGMVGGGRGAFIGAVHRMGAWLDGNIELVSGAFSANAEKSKAAWWASTRG
jgi:hypothetical protein